MEDPVSGGKVKLTTDDKNAFDLFLEGRVAEWRQWADAWPIKGNSACTIVTFLGMSVEEYGDWFLGRLDDRGYSRLNRVWKFR